MLSCSQYYDFYATKTPWSDLVYLSDDYTEYIFKAADKGSRNKYETIKCIRTYYSYVKLLDNYISARTVDTILQSVCLFSAPYVKVYLVNGKKCIAKAKTSTARRTLDPLYQQQLAFRENFQGCILQVSCPFAHIRLRI